MGQNKSNVRIVIECILIACGLGIALDLVTAHVAVEYFTVHHPKVIDSTSPLVMALVWGIGAAWWFGAAAGGILAVVNSRRNQPLPVVDIRLMMIKTSVILWVVMMLILLTTYGLIGLIPMPKKSPTFDFDRRIMSVALTHMTEYVLGTIALIVVARKVIKLQVPE